MPGLVPGIHDFTDSKNKKSMDGRDKPGHDGLRRHFGARKTMKRASVKFTTKPKPIAMIFATSNGT